MTTERNYFCNLCRDSIRLLEPPMNEGVGIHFTSNKGGQFRFVSLREAENHLCNPCIKTIRELEK